MSKEAAVHAPRRRPICADQRTPQFHHTDLVLRVAPTPAGFFQDHRDPLYRGRAHRAVADKRSADDLLQSAPTLSAVETRGWARSAMLSPSLPHSNMSTMDGPLGGDAGRRCRPHLPSLRPKGRRHRRSHGHLRKPRHLAGADAALRPDEGLLEPPTQHQRQADVQVLERGYGIPAAKPGSLDNMRRRIEIALDENLVIRGTSSP